MEREEIEHVATQIEQAIEAVRSAETQNGDRVVEDHLSAALKELRSALTEIRREAP